MSPSVLLAIVLVIAALYVVPKLSAVLERTAIGRGFFWTVASTVAGLVFFALVALIVLVTLGLRLVLLRP